MLFQSLQLAGKWVDKVSKIVVGCLLWWSWSLSWKKKIICGNARNSIWRTEIELVVRDDVVAGNVVGGDVVR
jgi:hypothetical protein